MRKEDANKLVICSPNLLEAGYVRGDWVRVPRPGGVRGGVRGGVHPHRGQEDQDRDQREVRGQAEQNL